MPSPSPDTVTQLLADWQAGDAEALDQLIAVVYDELRLIARRALRRERANHTLTTTALVHEAFLNLVGQQHVSWQNRAHFLAISAHVMRRVLLMHARRRGAQKRGGGQAKLPLEDVIVVSEERADEFLAIDEVLQRLEARDTQLGRIVECRFFGGLTIEETAAAMDLSPTTVKRKWSVARAWMRRELRPGESP